MMTDAYLIKIIRNELPFMRDRGLPTLARDVEELTKRFETLQAAHKLLADREERLTQELVRLRP